MRCALKWDEEKDLIDQKLSAWGEMQSLTEEPHYKEDDIKNEKDKEFFFGFKMAFDFVCNILDNMVSDEEITEEISEEIQKYFPGELAMQLFSILDHQPQEE